LTVQIMAREVVRLEGLDAVLKTLRELGPAASQKGGPVRAVLRKAAKIIEVQAKANVAAIVAEPNIGGLDSKSTGLLEKSIRIRRLRAPPSGGKGEAFVVSVGKGIKRKYAANKRNVRTGRAGKTYELPPPAFYGWFLERGTERMRAHPWARPAFDQKKNEALAVFVNELPKAIVRLQKKLAKENRAKT
jgi:HK97 gp10 family phage protein